MVERSECDLSHSTLTVLDIGRLQLLSRIPICAGDSLQINSNVLVRLNQLRRPLAVDVKADVFLFYCPYRFTYKDQWIDFITDGGNESVTFPSLTKSRPLISLQYNSTVIPAHLFADWCNIWNHWFRDPGQDELVYSTYEPVADAANYGLICNHLKQWGTAQSYIADMDDPQYWSTITGDQISMYNIQTLAAKTKNEAYRQFLGSRYEEVMRGLSGSEPDNYENDVPELVWRDSAWLSGYDVNGTSGSEFGQTTGKGIGAVNVNMPRRFFSEHGTLYMFLLCRLPPMFEQTKQYLDQFNRPYHEIVPVPGVNFPPKSLNMSDLWWIGGSTPAGYVPAYQWYRDQPSYVHERFYSTDTAWQTLNRPTTWAQSVQCPVSEYDAMFQSMTLRHAVVNARHSVAAWRPIPEPLESIMGAI